jgi:hypothetical protein
VTRGRLAPRSSWARRSTPSPSTSS